MPEPFLEPLSERLKDMEEIAGRQLRTSRTATDPPFIFAYSPLDRDMLRFEASRMVEARLTHAWHELTWRCCAQRGGTVIDVGGNYGWYTLYSAALGCDVVTFEPVKQFRAVIAAGLSHNPPSFARRVSVLPHLVYDLPGEYTLRVPVPVPGSLFKRMLGMTGLVDGAFGLVKGVVDNYINVTARAVRLDDVLLLPELATGGRRLLDDGRRICMLKADVEGYEPSVLASADRLLRSGRVQAVQLELTKPADERSTAGRAQREATVRMLRALSAAGFDMRQVPNDDIDSNASLPPKGAAWSGRVGPWEGGWLLRFPSRHVLARTRERMASNRRVVRRKASRDPGAVLEAAWPMAYTRDVNTQSTNLIGRRRERSQSAP